VTSATGCYGVGYWRIYPHAKGERLSPGTKVRIDHRRPYQAGQAKRSYTI